MNLTNGREVTKDPETVLDSVIDEFKNLLKEDIDKKLPEGPGWQKLMRADKYSTRDYLLWWEKIKREDQRVPGTNSEPTLPVLEPDGFSFDTVQWIETFNGGTHWYNQAFSETVLEAMDFNYPKASWTANEVEKNIWWCVQGGASEIAKRMTDKVVNKPKYSQRVARISETDPTNPRQSKLAINLQDGSRQGVYDAVMNATTLGAMQHMNLSKIHLNYGTKQAIRTLNYGASCKVGIQFKNAWWITKSRVTEGGLGRTDLPIRTCVYPSYNLHDDHDAPAVLLCTYTWESDAERMGSMISRDTPGATVEQDYLKPLLIDNLARLHSDPSKEGDYEAMYEIINKSYHTHHAYNWFTDPEAVGAFAFFGPGQFSDMWPDIIKPSANGKLIVIGEHASAHHAWVVGALESAVRGVWQILDMHGDKISSAGEARGLLEKDSELPFGPLPLEFQPRPLQYLNIMSQMGVGRR